MADVSRNSTLEASKRRRATLKTKTTLSLAHPPPAVKHRQRLSIRPRLLLQLHEVSTASRPIPMFDVLPSVVFAPKVATKFPRLFKGKDGLGPNDLIVVKSQDYDTQQNELGRVAEDGYSDAREPLAAIYQKRGRTENNERSAEICFSNGRSCEISVNRNGRYDLAFVGQDGVRATARWVPRHKERSKTQDDSVNAPQEVKHTFSLIDPTTRRHPVIASLNSHAIEIYDHYSVLQSQTSPQSSPSSSQGPAFIQEDNGAYFRGSRTTDHDQGTIEVDEDLRTLITVSAIWVAFEVGYSPNYSSSRVPLPTTSEPGSPRLDKIRSTYTAPAQSPRHNLQPEIEQRKAAFARSSWAQKERGNLAAVMESPARQRAHTTGTSLLSRCSSRRASKNERPSSSGEALARGLAQLSPQTERGIKLSLAERSTRSVSATGPHRSTTFRGDGKAHQTQPLPATDATQNMTTGKVKHLFGLCK